MTRSTRSTGSGQATEEGQKRIGYAVVAVFCAVIALVLRVKGWPDCSAVATICAILFGILGVYWLGEYRQLQKDIREWQRRHERDRWNAI